MQPVIKTFAPSSGVSLDGDTGKVARLVAHGEVNKHDVATLTAKPAGIIGDAESGEVDAMVGVVTHGPTKVKIASTAGAWPAGENRFTMDSNSEAVPPVIGQYNVGYLDTSATITNGEFHDCFVQIADAVHA